MAAACGAGFLWGTGALVVNLLMVKFGQSAENISFWRFLIGALLLLALFGRKSLRPALLPQWLSQAPLLLAAGCCMALYVLFWFLAIARIGAAVPTLIALCLPPVLVSLWSVLHGRERLDAALVTWLLAALAGTALVVMRPHGAGVGGGIGAGAADAAPASAWALANTAQVAAGVALSIGSAVLYAAFTLVSGRLSTSLGTGPATTGLTVVAAAAMGATAVYTPIHWPHDLPPEAWLLYLGLVTAALALLAFNWGAARLSPTALTVATLVEPLTAVALAALLLGQTLSAGQWLGAVLMVSSIAALGLRDARRVKGTSDAV